MRWTATQVAEALGVALPAGLDPMAGVAGVSIDSRAIRPGELFLAIRGPRHDGHDFVAEALGPRSCGRGGGARPLARVSRRILQRKLFAVDDTLVALHRLACARLRNLAARETGTANGCGGRLRRKNHHKRNSWRRLWARGSAY